MKSVHSGWQSEYDSMVSCTEYSGTGIMIPVHDTKYYIQPVTIPSPDE